MSSNNMSALETLCNRIIAVGYPHTDKRQVLDAATTTNDDRFHLLEWLFARFDPKLIPPIIGSVVNSSVETLLQHGVVLGICTRQDHDIIEGTAGNVAQLEFMNLLLDMVELSIEHDVFFTSEGRSLDAVLCEDASLMSSLCGEDIDSMLSPICELLPPDLMQQCPKSNQEQRDLASLEMQTVSLQQQLDSIEQALDEETDAEEKSSMPSTEHQVRTIAVFLDTLTQQIDDVMRSANARFSTESNNNGKTSALVGIGDVAYKVLQELQRVEAKLKGVSGVVLGSKKLKSMRANVAIPSRLNATALAETNEYIRVMEDLQRTTLLT